MKNKYEKSPAGLMAFFKLCANTEDRKLRADLLDLFLSEKEKEALNDRYLIVQALLKSEKPQREIAKNLGVSIAKITRGSNELKRINKNLLAYLEKKL
ncbi:MAG: Trp operon repressor [Gammaproteobacteria bacterium]|jgi:TrpR family trp operon transcriptional repressor|nr:Trp operon repressor [Gammaproteobacteria bacterium]